MRSSFAENLRFPGEGNSAQGESDPKARPKGVVDGRRVNIPVPPMIVDRWGDGVWKVVQALVVLVQAMGWLVGKSAGVMSCVMSSHSWRSDWMHFRENPLGREWVSVPKLTQVGEMKILRRSREPSLRN